ncbi:MAG: hypothetical protein D6677_13000 [Calditrichaeota bacterium]|nr:MAG: hypothetical protein D6677_13000 [Calditrichota bacterium]
MKKLIFSVLIIPLLAMSQENRLAVFKPLVGKTWRAEGKWSNGRPFIQEKTFEYGLDSTIVLVNTTGFVDREKGLLGKRNFGIRQYDKHTDTIKFWEFDVFGGLSTGTVQAEGKNLIYQYAYGDKTITNMWIRVNDTTWLFKVGIRQNGKWEKLYLETRFKWLR